ncbi:hypothetical protein BKN14_05545 [Candidatus Gracilibacteria bacterium HOT-871]|nr:hypothetical protein BKN14_05545 [Candidatus Gracilibacteria bacterium HOT-871]MBB1564922.1 LysM peptidoglycan-binding domain-containing protein [Candidatus Gracilibacteria bacterium]MBF0913968.1 LysM peptidoglycan-binding domain-containing protein [Candidatus Gracilibacteria bacterium]RKW21810.1 MAG: LysM peptidoglycan-binding domain-containing protein [Candidatus Gracilibacteria bacterium]
MGKDRVNIKARINRHLRILRQNVGFESKTFRGGKLGYGLTVCLIFVVFIFPIYPSLSNIVYTNTETDFYRGDIDESSIISAYEGIPDGDQSHLLEHIDSYFSVNTILGDDRDLNGVNETVNYEVRAGDSIASIAEKFQVSKNTVLWANNMEEARELVVGEKIRVPSVTGYTYKVKKGDMIENIAKEYGVTVEAIEKANNIKDGYIIAGKEILLPGAAKKIPVVVKPKPVPTTNNSKNTTKTTKTSNTKKASTSGGTSEYTSQAGGYQLVWRAPKWRFAYGNCTWYVAQYKNVNWSGNANQWITNARAKGHATGSTPQLGAIVQFSGRGYNPIYGHVGIVVGINGGNIIVSDMNYRRINETTTRQVPIGDASIDGYIYVD